MDKETISGILKLFMNAITTIPLSTLESECNFSAMIMIAKQAN
jgi:hypothetical protein